MDNAVGDFKTDIIYDDANPDQIESLAPTQPHRNVDLELLKADREGMSPKSRIEVTWSETLIFSGYIRAYFILPSTIWGIAEGVLVERGIQNPYSQQVPALVRASLDRGRAGMIGKGKNVWPNVHIKEGTSQPSYNRSSKWLTDFKSGGTLYPSAWPIASGPRPSGPRSWGILFRRKRRAYFVWGLKGHWWRSCGYW